MRDAIIRPNDPLLWIDTSKSPSTGNVVPCLLCGKPFIMPLFVGEPDQLCPACLRDYDELARVICSKCKLTIGRAIPGIIESGYYIRPGSILHVDACNICRPGLPMSTVVEIAQWEHLYRPRKIIVPSIV